MRIISSFKDYYDHGLVYGYDPNIQYIRKTESHKLTTAQDEQLIQFQSSVYTNSISAVGFCGEIFPFNNVDHQYHFDRDFICNHEFIIHSSRRYGYEIGVHKIENISKYRLNRNIEQLNEFVKTIENFELFKYAPIFVVKQCNETILNHSLLDVQFMQIYNSVEAFQKLSTWMSTAKYPHVETEMTEEQRGTSKGFDRFSFRHQNTKKNPKKF